MILRGLFCAAVVIHLQAGGPQNVLIVINESSAISRTIGEYYARKRAIPLANVCRIRAPEAEAISRAEYDALAQSISGCLTASKLVESILYIVTTSGVPLRIRQTDASKNDGASVDSELAALYEDLHGRPHPVPGSCPNPFFRQRDKAFSHPEFRMYLVTRLTGYDFAAVRGIIDRALQAVNRGKFVIDLRAGADRDGNAWLRDAAIQLPAERVVMDDTAKVLSDQTDVIGYASWGSNDPARKERFLKFRWLPGAIMTEFVSTNARTFTRPPDSWRLGTWSNSKTWFAGAPQTLTGDYIQEGVTGASGHVEEPYLAFTPRPEFLLPAYLRGRNLAESYYLSIPALSWQNVVIGDPLCSLR
jgi:uncharacterized protein (TIGR03790 family)